MLKTSPAVAGPWPVGMNNRLPANSLPKDQNGRTTALRNAVNVDLDSVGNARRRAGYTKVFDGLNTHSGFSCSAGTFFVSGTNLMRLNDDDTSSLIHGGLVGPVCYTAIGTTVYLSDGVTTGRIVNGVYTSWPLDTHLLDDAEYMAVPAATILKQHNGRIYSAAGKVVWFTDPFTYGGVHRQRNFIQFPEAATVIEPVTGGIWIVADKTYFFRGGGPEQFVVEIQLDYGAVPGTSVPVPYTNDVMWYSRRGVVMATQDGQIKNIQEQNVAVEDGVSGASLVREENGVKQFITRIAAPTLSPLTANSFIAMEVIRKAEG